MIDIGFVDAVEPGVEEIHLPVMLDFPAPRMQAYPRETVVAEKFQAMVLLGLFNSRLKDCYDIWMLSRNHAFDVERLSRDIAPTFERRRTAISQAFPDALTSGFATDPVKLRQWEAFTRDLASEVPSLEIIVADLAGFLMPHARRALERTSGRCP